MEKDYLKFYKACREWFTLKEKALSSMHEQIIIQNAKCDSCEDWSGSKELGCCLVVEPKAYVLTRKPDNLKFNCFMDYPGINFRVQLPSGETVDDYYIINKIMELG